ncbi:hypothetical protein E8D34_14885 [Nocardioides sp. GY 10113]|uniref:hypothetical protein n=1 Tax=Nocardioides sp. GY 10113 TaxID=2569761 RepID=UPI0010A78136|nr:hypothetical protein [Nocardioides sp. GY 10113]TIC83847.1 hypothetical protein E8D34_14885 [Nocardioides sp. GY 10113]
MTLSVTDEVARLYRPDCPVEFIAVSDFKARILADPTWPLACATRYLAARPSAWDLDCLAKRGDIAEDLLTEAAIKGYRRTPPGLARARYLQLPFLSTDTLRSLSDSNELELRVALRHPQCPEQIVTRCLTSPRAAVRWSALRAVRRRRLPIDSAYIRAAADLPMTESAGGPTTGYRRRVESVAKQILESR